MLERKFSPEVLAAMRSNHLGACVVEEGAWVKGKQPTFTIHRKLEDAVARCEHIASNYLRAVSGSESGIMADNRSKDQERIVRKQEKDKQEMRSAEEGKKKQNMFQKAAQKFKQARDWAANTWVAKAVYNDYTAGAVADVRRRTVEEGWYGKTLDDTVNRQSFGEFKKNAVAGEETGPRWKTDKEFEAWFDAKMAQHRPDYSPNKFYGRDQDQQQNQDQGRSRGMER